MSLLLALLACGGTDDTRPGPGPGGDPSETGLAATDTAAPHSDTGLTSVDCQLPEDPTRMTSWEHPVICALREKHEGVQIREGFLRWLNDDLCSELIQTEGTCYGNHPSSPYGMFDFPEDDQGTPLATYQIDQDEAVLYVGLTPPPARYFGFTNYQYDRWDGSQRVSTFGSIGPTLNFLDIAHAGGQGAPFGVFTAVLFTANKQVEQQVIDLLRPILEDAGIDPQILVDNSNDIPYLTAAEADDVRSERPGDPWSVVELTLGYGSTSDDLMVIIRIAIPEDGEDPFFDPLQSPGSIFKIRFDEPVAHEGHAHDYPMLPPEDAGTGESQGNPVATARDRIAEELEARVPPGLEARINVFENDEQKSGFWCINDHGPYGCGANNDDARYLKSYKKWEMADLDDRQTSIFVIGVRHAEVPTYNINAPRVTYSSVSLKNETIGLGVLSVVDTDHEGSLQHFIDDYFDGDDLGLTPDQKGSIYVHRFARHCDGEPYCTVIPSSFPGVDPDHRFNFVERAYLNQTLMTAPHQSMVYEPRAVSWGTNIRDDGKVIRLN